MAVYWAQFMEERRWMPGTVLVIPSDVPAFSHFAMIEFTNFLTGIEFAIHNMPRVGVTRVPLEEAIRGKCVKVVWMPQTPDQGEAAVMRMQSLIGHPYDLIRANCEHVIRWAVTGEWQSEQVAAVKTGLLVASAVAVAASL